MWGHLLPLGDRGRMRTGVLRANSFRRQPCQGCRAPGAVRRDPRAFLPAHAGPLRCAPDITWTPRLLGRPQARRQGGERCGAAPGRLSCPHISSRSAWSRALEPDPRA